VSTRQSSKGTAESRKRGYGIGACFLSPCASVFMRQRRDEAMIVSKSTSGLLFLSVLVSDELVQRGVCCHYGAGVNKRSAMTKGGMFECEYG
jgi:hypothetical protein